MSPAMAIVKELTEKHEKRIAELEAALRPFADFYTPSMELAGDGHVITQGSSMARRQITVGDVRRAYKSLGNL